MNATSPEGEVLTSWHPTKYPGYSVSEDGRVKGPSGKILKPSRHKHNEHLRVIISLGSRGCAKTEFVHVLVLETLVGSRPDGLQGCHRDGNSDNNHVSNLYWGTPRQNSLDRFEHGTMQVAILTSAQVQEIRQRHVKGTPFVAGSGNTQKLANEYGVSRSTIQNITTGRTWGHV